MIEPAIAVAADCVSGCDNNDWWRNTGTSGNKCYEYINYQSHSGRVITNQGTITSDAPQVTQYSRYPIEACNPQCIGMDVWRLAEPISCEDCPEPDATGNQIRFHCAVE